MKGFYFPLLNFFLLSISAFILNYIGYFKWVIYTAIYTGEGNRKSLFLFFSLLSCFFALIIGAPLTLIFFIPFINESLKNTGIKNRAIYIYSSLIFIGVFGCFNFAGNPALMIFTIITNIPISEYFRVLFPYALGCIIFIIILSLFFIRRGRYSMENIENPDDYVKDWTIFNAGMFLLPLTYIVNFYLFRIKIPIFISSLILTLTLLILALRKRYKIGLIFRKTIYFYIKNLIILILFNYIYNNNFNGYFKAEGRGIKAIVLIFLILISGLSFMIPSLTIGGFIFRTMGLYGFGIFILSCSIYSIIFLYCFKKPFFGVKTPN